MEEADSSDRIEEGTGHFGSGERTILSIKTIQVNAVLTMLPKSQENLKSGKINIRFQNQ